MQQDQPLKMMTFSTPKDFSDWLSQHHASESELWIKVFKKKTSIQSINWNEIVIEALCWGWIDGIKKSVDEQSYLQRVTPRKAKSPWSKKNTENVERLLSENRIMPPGLVHINAAKADGRWQNAYTASEIAVPDDFLAAVAKQPKVERFYQTLNKSSRYIIAYGLTSAKKAHTREKRFEKFMLMLINEEKPK